MEKESEASLVAPEILAEAQACANRILSELDRILLGHHEVHRLLLIGILSRGHILLEGLPGVGKTALVKALGALLSLDFKRIQFTPDLLPGDILGCSILRTEPDGTRRMTFQPGAIVMCCGADSVTGDRLGCFNLTLRGHAACVEFIRKLNLPMRCWAEAGSEADFRARNRYTIKNVSRTWSYETAVLLKKEVSDEIPYNNFIEWYAPTYKLHLDPSPTLENKNSQEYLDKI